MTTGLALHPEHVAPLLGFEELVERSIQSQGTQADCERTHSEQRLAGGGTGHRAGARGAPGCSLEPPSTSRPGLQGPGTARATWSLHTEATAPPECRAQPFSTESALDAKGLPRGGAGEILNILEASREVSHFSEGTGIILGPAPQTRAGGAPSTAAPVASPAPGTATCLARLLRCPQHLRFAKATEMAVRHSQECTAARTHVGAGNGRHASGALGD